MLLLIILMEKKLFERFTKTIWQKKTKDFRIEKVIKIKGDNLYVKWKRSFNTWADKKKTYYK